MATVTENYCDLYPYSFAQYRKPRTLFTLDALGHDVDFRTLFATDFRAVLRAVRRRTPECLSRVSECLGASLPPADEYHSAVDALIQALNGPMTLQWLMETPQTMWPSKVLERTSALSQLGFYINCQLIPNEGKTAVANYFSSEGDDFVGLSGSLTLQDYFELPRSAYSAKELALLEKGRRLGVLMCHTAAIESDTEKEKSCWNGRDCQSTELSKMCNGDSASSDPC